MRALTLFFKSMVLVLQEKPSATQARTDAMVRTISTRNAGGKTIEVGRPLVRGLHHLNVGLTANDRNERSL